MNELKLEPIPGEIKFIEPDYEGISKVLSEFEKLYKVCNNQDMLDKLLEGLFLHNTLIKTN